MLRVELRRPFDRLVLVDIRDDCVGLRLLVAEVVQPPGTVLFTIS